jgi:carbon-monoxide dehydrogenase small subunit
MQVTMTVNGEQVTAEVEPRMLLVHFLRDHLQLTGTHWGCDTSNCGTCVVDVDGEPVKSCTILAAMASGHSVRTVEGLEVDGRLDPIQEGFMQCHGLQCGFCTPGILMITARALLDHNPDPTEDEIREAISGQICRCTGYTTIVRSGSGRPDTRTAASSNRDQAPTTSHPRRRPTTPWDPTPASTSSKQESVMTTVETQPEDVSKLAADNDQKPCGHGRMLRKEDPRFIRGRGNYVDDISLPGMLHPAILRSPYAHARINSIDVTAAEAHPKVKAVVTGADLAEKGLA